MDILIVKLGALGDVINTLPLVVQLKNHLSARIHWLVAPLSSPIVSKHPCVDTTILFDKSNPVESTRYVINKLRARRFDLTLDLQRILKSSVFCMLARSRRRIGFDRGRCKENTHLFPFERIAESDPQSHMILQYLEFGYHMGIRDNTVSWGITSPDTAMQNLPPEYVVLNIGATKPANRWTAEGFAELTNMIFKKFGMVSVLAGGGEDRSMAEEITSNSACEPVDLSGKTTIEQLITVLANSRAVVTCDTGPMHLAVALGKEVVALFGPSDWRRTGPYRGRVVQKQLHCSPCNAKRCDDTRCMKEILPDDVMRELVDVLKGKNTTVNL